MHIIINVKITKVNKNYIALDVSLTVYLIKLNLYFVKIEDCNVPYYF